MAGRTPLPGFCLPRVRQHGAGRRSGRPLRSGDGRVRRAATDRFSRNGYAPGIQRDRKVAAAVSAATVRSRGCAGLRVRGGGHRAQGGGVPVLASWRLIRGRS